MAPIFSGKDGATHAEKRLFNRKRNWPVPLILLFQAVDATRRMVLNGRGRPLLVATAIDSFVMRSRIECDSGRDSERGKTREKTASSSSIGDAPAFEPPGPSPGCSVPLWLLQTKRLSLVICCIPLRLLSHPASHAFCNGRNVLSSGEVPAPPALATTSGR